VVKASGFGAGIVGDQDVDLRNGADDRLEPCGIGQISRHGTHLRAGHVSAQGGGSGLEPVGAAAVEDDLHSLASERASAGMPQALGGGRDERATAGDPEVHQPSVPSSGPSDELSTSSMRSLSSS